MSFTILLACLSCLLLFSEAYEHEDSSHVLQPNWFFRPNNRPESNDQNRIPTSRQSRQVFAFPDGDSPAFDQGFSQNGRSRQLGNNRGFTWGSSNNNNNNNNRRRLPSQNDIRPLAVEDDDVFIFDQNDGDQGFSRPTGQSSTQRTPTSTVAVPGMGTTRSACEDACLTTPEYNPICGDDGLTYFSKARLRCAQKCGKRVGIQHIGACPRFR